GPRRGVRRRRTSARDRSRDSCPIASFSVAVLACEPRMRRSVRTRSLHDGTCSRRPAYDGQVPGRPYGAGEMANERLRAALLQKGVSIADLAQAIQVDPKTVERWVTKGREPYRKHRFAAAS